MKWADDNNLHYNPFDNSENNQQILQTILKFAKENFSK